jgi:proteasome lid subunit RPN8/RPN11
MVPDPERGWPVARLVALAEASPGAEVCGLLVRDGRGEVVAWPMVNVAPTPATAFEVDPAGLLAALRWLQAEGADAVAVYHSHLAGGLDLSARDLEGALADGVPVLPGAAQLVVALQGGRARGVRAHLWSGRAFEPVDLRW